MKIVISATNTDIDQAFNPRFGRCEYFILVDTETQDWEALANPAADATGGAGPQAVKFIAGRGAEAVVSGRYGPSAFTALDAAGIKAYIATDGSVKEVLDHFLADKLPCVTGPTGGGLHGA
jgi:predicted Fe-Mo cluster-binding NifX family protein